MIKLRIDVDYPYPSRVKSFFYTALNVQVGRNYLKNSKILARMINESQEEVKAYWFFTPKTIPDEKLLDKLNPEKHEIALHIVNHPYEEMRSLGESTGRKIKYYTIHGTASLPGRILWRRWKSKAPKVPLDFPLKSFHQFPTLGLDVRCYSKSITEATEIAKDSIAKGKVLQIHPEWIFQRGTINHRGPYYEVLRRILHVDEELKNLAVWKKLSIRLARNVREYEKDVSLTEKFVAKLRERDIDIFTLIERSWCHTFSVNPPKTWMKVNDNVALLQITNFDEWWKKVGKKTRNMVRKAKKSGVIIKIAVADRELAQGIWEIYNETPVRQGRSFPHFGVALKAVERRVFALRNCTFIGAYFGEELVGFIQLVHGDNVSVVSQILSLQKHWDKAVNNALLAKAIEVCVSQQVKWLIYGRMGNHPLLDRFKQNNGFTLFSLKRYYIPLTTKGKIATKLRLHREFRDTLPQSISYNLMPVYNWISRMKMRKPA